MTKRSWVIHLGRRSTENVETLIDLPQDKEAGIGGDLCALKINADGPVEIRPYGFLLFVTNRAHADSPFSDEFAT
jgi:hypothetical protein